jgi:hypothetical protein
VTTGRGMPRREATFSLLSPARDQNISNSPASSSLQRSDFLWGRRERSIGAILAVLEYVPSWRLTHHEEQLWHQAARWVAELHIRTARLSNLPDWRVEHILVYDADVTQLWPERALTDAEGNGIEQAGLRTAGIYRKTLRERCGRAVSAATHVHPRGSLSDPMCWFDPRLLARRPAQLTGVTGSRSSDKSHPISRSSRATSTAPTSPNALRTTTLVVPSHHLGVFHGARPYVPPPETRAPAPAAPTGVGCRQPQPAADEDRARPYADFKWAMAEALPGDGRTVALTAADVAEIAVPVNEGPPARLLLHVATTGRSCQEYIPHMTWDNRG